jgi:hypothetical protein
MIVVFFLCTREAPDAADNATALYCAALSILTADRLRTLMLYATRCPGTSCSRRSRRWRGSAPCQRSRAARVRGTSPTTPGGSESYRAGAGRPGPSKRVLNSGGGSVRAGQGVAAGPGVPDRTGCGGSASNLANAGGAQG